MDQASIDRLAAAPVAAGRLLIEGAWVVTEGEGAIDERVENGAEAATIARSRDELKLQNAILVTVPVPTEFELDRGEVEALLAEALKLADERGIIGKEITPFLLSQLSERSKGKTLAANIALLENNARVAGEIAKALSEPPA